MIGMMSCMIIQQIHKNNHQKYIYFYKIMNDKFSLAFKYIKINI